MSRCVSRLAIVAIASLAALSVARAGGPFHREADPDCIDPHYVTARYKEQVCYRGQGGYVACDWVRREHEVRVPGACEPKLTGERGTPANRGAFPGPGGGRFATGK